MKKKWQEVRDELAKDYNESSYAVRCAFEDGFSVAYEELQKEIEELKQTIEAQQAFIKTMELFIEQTGGGMKKGSRNEPT